MLPPNSIRGALGAAGGLEGRTLSDATRSVPLGRFLTHTSLSASRAALAGRRVLLSAADQFAAAVALTELDGLAARVVLCPPDLKPEHYPAILAGSAVDTIVSDLAEAEWFSRFAGHPGDCGDPGRPAHGNDLVEDPARDPGLRGNERALDYVRCHWPMTLADKTPVPAVATEWLLMTSGTTGAPKMVQHGFAGLTAAIKPRTSAGRPLVWATFYDIRRYGGLQIFLRGLLGSGSLLLSEAGEPIADTLARYGAAGVTHLSGTPSHWRRALMSPAIELIRPDYVRLSGEIADQMVLDSLRAQFPQADIGHAYASTEAGVGFEVDDGLEGFPRAYLDRRDTPVAMKVVDGSLRIRSDRAAARYVGSDDILFDPDGFVDTGDMVAEREGRMFFVGRRNGVINVGGLKVHPEEIEAVINRHAGVRMSLVQGRRNPITGAVVVAAVVLKDGDAAPPDGDRLRSEITEACRRALPAHKVPALVRFVPHLEVTPAGKLVRPHV